MPRKKKTEQDEPISVLQSDTLTEALTEPINEPSINPIDQPTNEAMEAESYPRDYLAASIRTAQASMSTLFETQAALAGTQIADKVFDQLEEAFVNRLQQRLQPFVDTLLPEIKDSSAELQQRTAARVERRLSAFDRIRQIATLITDECRLSLPSNEPTGNLLGFASWEPVEQKENE